MTTTMTTLPYIPYISKDLYIAAIRLRSRQMKRAVLKDFRMMRQMILDGPVEVGTIRSAHGGHDIKIVKSEIVEVCYDRNQMLCSRERTIRREYVFKVGPAEFTCFMKQTAPRPHEEIGDDEVFKVHPRSELRITVNDPAYEDVMTIDKLEEYHPFGWRQTG